MVFLFWSLPTLIVRLALLFDFHFFWARSLFSLFTTIFFVAFVFFHFVTVLSFTSDEYSSHSHIFFTYSPSFCVPVNDSRFGFTGYTISVAKIIKNISPKSMDICDISNWFPQSNRLIWINIVHFLFKQYWYVPIQFHSCMYNNTFLHPVNESLGCFIHVWYVTCLRFSSVFYLIFSSM